MSDIAALLATARESVARAIANLQSTLAQSGIAINSDYSWDGGDGLLEFDARGAGTEALSQGMAGIANLLNDDPALMEPPYRITPEIKQYLDAIANARGISMAQAQSDYIRFLELMDTGGITITPVESYGTLSHLRFGFLVGEALEIDPAFASLMSEYGGLTGPGSKALNIDGDGLVEELLSGSLGISNEALAYHAPTHDAFGFLKTHFDIGPGYCYVPDGGDCIAGNESGLSGQISGISYWNDKLNISPLDAAAEAGGEILGEVGEAGGEIWREAGEKDVLGTTAEILEGGVETGREVLEGVVDIGNEIKGDGIPFVPGL